MKVVIAGYGSIGKRHLRSFLRVRPNYEYALLRRSSSLSSEVPEHVRQLTSVAETKHLAPDLLCICTPSQQHREDIEKLVPATKHLFVEKPLITAVHQAKDCLGALSGLEGMFFYGCVMRFLPVVEALRELARSTLYGRVLSYHCECGSYLPEWRAGADYRTLYAASAQSGGVALDLIHEFDYPQWCFGPIASLNGVRAKVSALEIASEDLCCAVAEHSTGVRGTISLNYYQRKTTRTCAVVCEGANVHADLLTGRLSIELPGKPAIWRELGIDRDRQFDVQSQRMFETIERGETSPWDAREAVMLIERVLNLPKH